MLDTPLAPYLLWAKTRTPAAIDLAGSNLLGCGLDDLPGAADALTLTVKNDLGYAPLVDTIAMQYGVSPDRVVTAQGCSGANFLAIAALVGAGDEVLVEQPGYDPLAGACRLMGARLVALPRRVANLFDIDLADVEARATDRTRLIVVSTPHNPSGRTVSEATLRGLAAIAARVGAHVLVDEVYQDAANLAADPPAPPETAARLDGPIVTTNSLTKSYGLAGLRCGWVIAPPGIAARIRRTRDVVDNIGAAPAERLSVLAFAHLAALGARSRSILGGNLARARTMLLAEPRLSLVEAPRASVVFPRLVGASDAEPFVERLHAEHGVAVAPGRFFGEPAHFRISLAGAPADLAAGLDRLGRALQSAERL